MKDEIKIYLAPLRGCTNFVYRRSYRRFFKGIDAAVSPFIRLSSKYKNSYLKDILPENNRKSIPVIPQVLGNHLKLFKKLSKEISALGYDEININCGCPHKPVVKRGLGAGMLADKDILRKYIDGAVESFAGKISVKMRTGIENHDDALSIVEILNDYPLASLTIHPRLSVDKYEGDVDLDVFGKCLEQSKHNVIYNGDILTLADYENITERFDSLHGVMIGRGILQNPFLVGEIMGKKQKTLDQKLRLMRDFHDDVFASYKEILSGYSHLANNMKEFWSYNCKFFPNSKGIVSRIWSTKNEKQYLLLVDKFFTRQKSFL